MKYYIKYKKHWESERFDFPVDNIELARELANDISIWENIQYVEIVAVETVEVIYVQKDIA